MLNPLCLHLLAAAGGGAAVVNCAAAAAADQCFVSFSIKLVKFMMELRPWTGWNKNKKEELQLHLQQQLVFGKIIELILSIRQDTLILQLKLKGH